MPFLAPGNGPYDQARAKQPGLTSLFKPLKPAIEIGEGSLQHLPVPGVLGGCQLRENGLPRQPQTVPHMLASSLLWGELRFGFVR
jgi:hypothetical protein